MLKWSTAVKKWLQRIKKYKIYKRKYVVFLSDPYMYVGYVFYSDSWWWPNWQIMQVAPKLQPISRQRYRDGNTVSLFAFSDLILQISESQNSVLNVRRAGLSTNKVTSVLVWTYWSVVPLAMFLSQFASFQTVPPPRSALLAILWLLDGSTPLITLVANHCNLHRGNCFQWSPSADLLSRIFRSIVQSVSEEHTF